MIFDLDFYKGKRVLLTGHTGFKGSWMSVMLVNAGAEIAGYSTCSKTDTRLFDICGIEEQLKHIKGDVIDLDHLTRVFKEFEPEIVIHMAAQPIVREGYNNPVGTYATNIMGTVNVCEAVRQCDSVRSFLNVTTDKVYENREWEWGYRECDPLDGYDPYSNSKSCSELVTHCFKNSFFSKTNVAVSTARAGNVIGGGDFAKDRIIPDCVRAAIKGEDIIVRNPDSIRPYQHVLEPVYAYLMIAGMQYQNADYQSWYNIGPDDNGCISTGKMADLFVKHWGEGIRWINKSDNGPHEARYLKLDCSKMKSTFDWHPHWNIETAVEKTVEWSKAWVDHSDMRAVMNRQIDCYLNEDK